VAGIVAALGRAEQGSGRRKEGGGERLTDGAQSSASAGKKKKEEEGDGPLRERDVGPAGRLGRKVRRVSSLFFPFLFQTLFKSNFSF
jgi:hypothetical protein